MSAPGYPHQVMATRTIVTSQPDIACHVCERRLLRGEQPELFLAAGQPRTVCELCAPRAAHEGWLREADPHSVSLPPARARRGRNLFERLRQVGRATDVSPPVAARSPSHDREPEAYDFLGGTGAVAAEPVGALAEDRSGAQPSRAVPAPPIQPSGGFAPPVGRFGDDPAIRAEFPDALLERAVEVFNAGEYPRRVAGLARSLGVPGVSVRADEDFRNVVAIVVAWELSWYRYEVDLDDDGAAAARVRAQGTELDELARRDRLTNAVVDELGVVSLIGAQP
jgi:hypothetical protein